MEQEQHLWHRLVLSTDKKVNVPIEKLLKDSNRLII
jgi:hypothetical protein